LYLGLDIETENTGLDIIKDNKRILSVQLGNNVNQELYWADSKNPQWNLERAKREILSHLSKEVKFIGYNLKGFDIPMIKQFLNIDITEKQILDLCLCQPQRISQLTGKNRPRLEEICSACGIEVRHKQRMNERANKYKSNESFKTQALTKAKELVKNKGWSFDFSYNYALDKVAGGNAIYDAYLEFAKSNGQKNMFFYEYAIGDIISEYNLLKKLGY
jgi:hypothetical protein